MLKDLNLYNLAAEIDLSNFGHLGSHFVLKTCQRTLILTHGNELNMSPTGGLVHGIEQIRGQLGYQFLLEVICGLKSRLIGENEIVSQFKKAYQNYVCSENKNTELLLILEKLFKDAKAIRSEYLTGISQKTYASITRKEFVQKNKAKEIVILGSGQLAQDLINQFVKYCDISICARNPEKLKSLQNIDRCKVISWENKEDLIHHPFIANTIGYHGVLLDEKFFQNWNAKHQKNLFVDLGSPSCIKTHMNSEHGVLRLDDILNEGAILEENKREKIAQAQAAIFNLAERRKTYLQQKTKLKQSFINHGAKQTAHI